MGGRSAKRKGSQGEREVVKIFERHGLSALKTPLSGAIGGDWKGDVHIKINGRTEIVEVKRRRAGFKVLYRWLGANFLLATRDDQSDWLVVMRLEDFAQLVRPE